MGIRRLNHAVLYVRDVDRSVAFYTNVLGFTVVHRRPTAAFLRAAESDNDHDLGLFGVRGNGQQAGTGVGLYHLAWSVGTLPELAEFAEKLARVGAWSARRTTRSRSRCTARTRTASSSRSRGSSPATA